MNFKAILRGVANVGTTVFLGQPLFVERDETGQPKDWQPIVPADTSNKIVAAIASVELMTNTLPHLQGAEKLSMGAALVSNAVLQSSTLIGSEVVDHPRFALGVSKITDGWNDVIKSVKKK